MELYFMRHGIAEDHAPDGRDASRRLTEEGHTLLEAARAGLARLRVAPDLLFSSPLMRAHQTAEIIGAHLGLTPLVAPELAPGCELGQLLGLLAAHQGAQRIMVVGHEPDLSSMIGALTGGRVRMKKGALARVDMAQGSVSGTLAWLVPPRGLR